MDRKECLIMKKILCFFLSMFLLLNIVNMDILRINSLAEDNTSEYATVKVITNNIPEKVVEGAQTGADIKTKKESKTTLIKKDNKIYMSLNDICEFTRTHKEKADNKYILKQGMQEITVFIDDNGNSKLESLYGDFNIQTVTENNKVYCEPEPIMSMLFAECTYYENTLLIDLPQYTVYEATNFDYSKYQSDVISFGIDENTDNMGTALIKWGLVVQRTALSFSSDIIVDANYGYFATDNTIRQYYYEAFNEVLGYDIYSNESVTEEETKIYEKINDLGSFLEKTQGGDISDTPFTDFYISSYIDSYANKGLKDNNSLSTFNDTIRDLSTNARVNEKLNSYLNQSGKDVLTNILFNSALEYIKRSSYDRKVLEMFKTLYSENTVNKYNISLSENGQFIFQCAKDYYNSCGSFDDIVKEVAINESINKFSEMIIKGLFSITTAGKSQEIFETYETVLTAEKLQESNSSFKPVEKINNSAKYFWLAKMQYTTLLTLDEISKKAEESLNSEDVANYVRNLDFYNRISAVMIKTLTDSYQLPTTTQREKDLVAHSDTYISDLCRNIYKLECCEYNLPTKEELNNKNCDVFKNFFANQEFKSTENYDWHLSPTIEAEDIIVPDNKDIELEEGYVSPYDECALIKQDGKYGIIQYDGTNIAEPIYKFGSYDIQGAIGVYNEYDPTKGTERVDVFSDKGKLKRQINQERGWGYVGSTYYWDNHKQRIYQYEGSPVYDVDNLSYNVVVQSADIEENGKVSNISEKYGIANQNKLLVPIEYDKGYMHSFNNITALEKENRWTYFDKDGKVIIKNCDGFTSNNRIIDWWTGGDWYNHNNDYILPYLPTENYIPVKINGQCGYYDTQGNEVIPCGTFEEVRPVHNGLAWVKKDGKWGVIELDSVQEEKDTTVTEFNVNWKEIYAKELREYLNSKEYMSDSMFDIFDIDGDDIPELVISDSAVYMGTCKIYTISNGNLVKPNDERYGSCGVVYCSEKLHMLYGDYLQHGRFIFSFYQLTKNGVERILSGYNDEYAVFDETPTYQIDGENVTKEKYEEEYHKYNLEDFEEVGRKYELNESTIASVLLGEEVAELTEEAEIISDIEILWAVNKYLEENKGHLGTYLTVSDAPYCPTEHLYSNETNWSCPINLSWESYSSNEIAGAYPHFAYVDKSTLKCTLTANYKTVIEFDLKGYLN